MTDIETRIRKVIRELRGVDEANAAAEVRLDSMIVDSLEVVEITMALEDEFAISIELDQERALWSDGTIGDLIKLVEGKFPA